MSDRAFQLLQSTLQSGCKRGLWIADENLLSSQIAANPDFHAISNRWDLHQHLLTQGWQSEYSDFDFSQMTDSSHDRVVYRVSKEKPVVHHVINEAFRILQPGGQLWLAGDKGEGIKTYFDKTRKLFGDGDIEKADKDTWLGIFNRTDSQGPLLDTQQYPKLRETVADDNYHYWSKPGVFGWNKVDKGSAYLIEHLDSFLMMMPDTPKNILDLGCGYGYLSLNAAHLNVPVTATDNNAAAVAACQRNFERYPVNGKVIAADCAEEIQEKFDLILCNPPFHAGFGVEGDLTDRFLQSTRQHLSAKGTACFVVNLHIPLERKALNWFHQVEPIAANSNFKLIRLSHPK
ncbi:methyltransferase [Marinobacterium jannaschii]|uniref:methyltransferase n=1 Tax=Marinobacterium jannaschii TaxID=64970 RepID=UPI0004840EAD|nr:methyltransferase [Marinobacterium jannaschii]